MIKKISRIITGVLVYCAVAIIAFPFFFFFELANGKSWNEFMREILNIK